MIIIVKCPWCGHRPKTKEEVISGKCSKCGEQLQRYYLLSDY